jgi:hypothetical protein
MPHVRKPFVPPVPAANTRYGTPDVEFVRNEKGKTVPQYTAAYIEGLRLEHEKKEDERQKDYENTKRSQEKRRILAQTKKVPIKPAEKESFLLARGIQHPAVAAKYIRGILFACQQAALPENVFAYEKGLIWLYQESVRLLENEERPGLLITEEEFTAEFAEQEWLLDYSEIVALWELAAFRNRWRRKTMRDWLDWRQKSRTDGWFLANTAFGLRYDENAHRPVFNHFIQDKTGRSRGLHLDREYSIEEFNDFLIQLDPIHRRLLLHPRDFFKSSLTRFDIAQWMICLPDIRCMYVSSTFGLSSRSIKQFRKIFECSEMQPTLFQELFPEYTIEPGDGTQREFQNPMARLEMAVPSVRAMSAVAQATGDHIHLLVFDDIAELKNTYTDVLREKLLEIQTSFLELVEQPCGFTQWVGTRWSNGPGAPDPYGDLLTQSKIKLHRQSPCIWVGEDTEIDLKVLVGSALEIHEDKKGVPLWELVEEDCTLMWPGPTSRGGWKVLKKKIGSTPKLERSFRQQQLNEAVGTEDDEGREFHEEVLEANYLMQMPLLPLNELDHFAFVDTRHFTGAPTVDGDESVGTFVTRHIEKGTGIVTLYVRHMFCTRADSTEVAKAIVDLYVWGLDHISPLKSIVIEKIGNMGDFLNTIERYSRALGRGQMPLNPLTPDKTVNAKTNRIVNAALRIKAGQLKFVFGNWDWEGFKEQAARFKGTAGHGRADDRLDTVGMACRYLMSLVPVQAPPKSVPLGTPKQPPPGMTPQELEAWRAEDKIRQEQALQQAYEAGQAARNSAAVRAMWNDRSRIEGSQAITQSQWQEQQKSAHRGFAPSTTPIDASGRRDAAGNLVNRWGIPQRQK